MNTVRLKPELREKMQQIATIKGISVSEVHREALDAYCAAELAKTGSSRFDDVIGVIEGPIDLTEDVGRKYAEAMAEKHARHAG